MIVCGIDVGLSGAVCLMDTSNDSIAVYDIPVHVLTRNGKTKREVDVQALVSLFSQRVGHAFIEQVGAMPGQGVSGVFAFGKTYGIIIGVLGALGAPMTFVPPRRWKSALGVPAEKDGARARASQLLPSAAHNWPLKKHSDRAESALIALYGLRSLQKIVSGEAA